MAVDWDGLASDLEDELEDCLSKTAALRSFRSTEIMLPAILAQLVAESQNQQAALVTINNNITTLNANIVALTTLIDNGIDVSLT